MATTEYKYIALLYHFAFFILQWLLFSEFYATICLIIGGIANRNYNAG